MAFTVDAAEKQELMCVFAALVLNDDKVAVTEENLNKLITAANGTVEPYWPKLFAGLLKDRDVSELVLNSGAAGPSTGGAATGSQETKEEEVVVEEEEEEEESDADMGFSLFD